MSHFVAYIDVFGVQKKWYKLSKLGEGGKGNLEKIQKNSNFFREIFPKAPSVDFVGPLHVHFRSKLSCLTALSVCKY